MGPPGEGLHTYSVIRLIEPSLPPSQGKHDPVICLTLKSVATILTRMNWGQLKEMYSRARRSGGVKRGVRTRWERWAPWPVRLRFYRNLARMVATAQTAQKRVLGVWDYKALPMSFGDPLMFVESLSVVKLETGADAVDICIIYDRNDPKGNRKVKNITVENVPDYMLDFLPLFSTSPFLGSVFQFNSREEFYRFFRQSSDRYHVYPPLPDHLGEVFNYVGGADLRKILGF